MRQLVRNLVSRSLAAALALLSFAIPAWATTYNVATVDDLTAALSQAEEGDEIVLAETTFEITSTITLGAGVTLRGAGVRENTIIKVVTAGIAGITIASADSTLRDLTISGANNSTDKRAAVVMSGGLVENCVFSNNQHGWPWRGPAALYMTGGRTTGCLFTGNKLANATYGIVRLNGASAVLERCRITATTKGGGVSCSAPVYVEAGLVDGCVIDSNPVGEWANSSGAVGVFGDDVVIRNCTMCKNGATNQGGKGGPGGIYWDTSKTGARFVNNIVYGNRSKTGPYDINDVSNVDAETLKAVFVNNLFETASVGTSPQTGDPLFSNYSQMDYTLTVNSPARNAGTSSQRLATKDFAGDKRVMGGCVDIGAYEYKEAAISCDLTADATAGNLTRVFKFTSTVSGAPSGAQTYAWTFTNDQTQESTSSTEANPSFTAPAVGTYTVRLVVTDGTEIAERERAAYLTVSNFQCSFAASPLTGLVGSTFRFTSTVVGATGDVAYRWTFTNELSGAVSQSTAVSPDYVPTEVGRVGVRLVVTDDAGETSAVSNSYLTVQTARTYVDPESTSAAFPYDTPAKAATNIVDAIAACGDGGEVILAQKTFKFAEPIVIDRGVIVRGEGAREATTLQITANNKHVVNVKNAAAVLKNVTITGSSVGYLAKGGLLLESGLVTNVVISGNVAKGTYAGPSAATVSGGRLTGSLICNNKGGHAEALAVKIGGTEANVKAGLGPEVDHCAIVDNSMSSSSDTCNGTVNLNLGLMHDCLIARNSCNAGDTSGVRIGSYGSLYNCTIADNDSGLAAAGGLYWASQPLARVVNCVIVGNTGSKCDWAKSGTTKDADLPKVFLNCLFDGTDIGGTNCKVASAGDTCQSLAGHDYSLVSGSVARDAGLASWKAVNSKVTVTVGGVDLAGNDRVMGTAVDLGAYEYDPSALSCDIKAVGKTADFVGSTFTLQAVVPEVEGTLAYDWTVRCGETELTSTEASPSFMLTVPGRYDVTLVVTLGAQQVSSTKLKYLLASPREQTVTPDGLTLAEALDMAIDGGEIRVSGAVSLETTAVVDKGITISGVTGNETDKLVGNDKETVIRLNHKDAVLRGVTVTGGSSGQNSAGGGVYITAEGGTVEDCIVEKNKLGYYGTGVGIYTSDNATNAVIRRTIIRDNSCHAAPPGLGVSLGAGVMESCLVTGNYGTGSPACAGVSVRTGKAHVRNCTIANQSGDGDKATASALFVVASALESGYPEIVNTVVAQNTNNAVAVSWRVGKQAQGGPLVDYKTNNFVKAFSRCVFDTDNLLDGMDAVVLTNLGFTADGTYRIEKTSALRDRGRWQPWMADATDLYGKPRVNCGKRVDIGCCEVPGGGGLLLLVR